MLRLQVVRLIALLNAPQLRAVAQNALALYWPYNKYLPVANLNEFEYSFDSEKLTDLKLIVSWLIESIDVKDVLLMRLLVEILGLVPTLHER
ncbi:hypothetical protein MiSe_94720 [Microseira wollei NIES-4236]|uniref:Uncharacterized protein n=1 Tax=Microseira wollei NIES-4236 TaxID=2530354 RepID=A0AAV3XSA5_9CYAN|nr:hypothetical protein MiSe_94720 [Microseira wollei NIES-4236]